jgi:hypothetical protein
MTVHVIARSQVSRIEFIVVVKMIVLLIESMQRKPMPMKMSFGDRAFSAMVFLEANKNARGTR